MKAAPRGGYLIKIVPPAGYRIFRIEFRRRHIALLAFALLACGTAVCGYYVGTLRRAEASVQNLRDLTNDQRDRLQHIDAQADELDSELRALERQNDQIRRMIGVRGAAQPDGAAKTRRESDPAQAARDANAYAAVAQRVSQLRQESDRVRNDGERLRGVALRVLNMHRLESLARARMLAAIPSINPAGGAGIASGFGWRLAPWPEFHEGLDLDANYGDGVRAAAAGTVVASGWDGGYGIKVDIDHGNGYHTWYCHLSRADVAVGTYVVKSQAIGLVGSTGASTGPHLHYQIMLDGKAIDPTPYLNGVPEKVLAQLK